MEGMSVTQKMVRRAFQSFGTNGQQISNAQLYEALGIRTEPEMARMRTRINGMIAHGEVIRIGSGLYQYNYKHRPREEKGLSAIWRFVRKSKPGWTISECALMLRCSYSYVLRYCNWLEETGYIEKSGRDAVRATTWRATARADASPETPYPPYRDADPFEKERIAAASIVRLMLCADPYAKKTAEGVVEACRVLLARFERVTKNENKEEV